MTLPGLDPQPLEGAPQGGQLNLKCQAQLLSLCVSAISRMKADEEGKAADPREREGTRLSWPTILITSVRKPDQY